MKYLTIFLIAGTLLSCQRSGTIDENKRFKTIMLKADGFVETTPNMATFRIFLECVNRNIKTSKKCLVEKSNILVNQLIEYGIDKDDILTTSVELDKRYNWNRNSYEFVGYESSMSLLITIRDLEKLDIVYTDLIDNKDLRLSNLNYSHSKLDSLQNEAYLNALLNANETADVLLTKLPENKKEVIKIGNVEISSSLPQKNLGYEELEYDFEIKEIKKREMDNNINISKGTVSVYAQLYVEYLIK